MEFEELLAGMSEGRRRAHRFEFESEEECLAHARKLIQLKPGDIVYVDGTQKGIFREWENGSPHAAIAYMDKDNSLSVMGAPMGCLTLEPREA